MDHLAAWPAVVDSGRKWKWCFEKIIYISVIVILLHFKQRRLKDGKAFPRVFVISAFSDFLKKITVPFHTLIS